MGFFANLFNPDQKKISECIDKCCKILEDAGYGPIEIQTFKQKQEEYAKRTQEEDKRNKRDKNKTIENICNQIENLECNFNIKKIERNREFLIENIKTIRNKYKNESEEFQELLISLEETKFKEDHGYRVDFDGRINLYIQALEKVGIDKEQLDKFRDEISKEMQQLPKKADEQSIKNVLGYIDISFWGKLNVVQKDKESGLFVDHVIDVDSIIKDCISQLEKEGYGEIEIEKFRESANSTKVIVPKSRIEDYLRKSLSKKIDEIKDDRAELEEKLEEKNKKISPEEQEVVAKRLNLKFDCTHGHPINLKGLASLAIKEMKVFGYGEEEIGKFREYAKDLIGKLPKKINSIEDERNVKSAFDLIYGRIDILTDTMIKDRDELSRHIEEIKKNYEVQEQKSRIKEAKLDFEEKHGKPIDVNARIQIFIDRLRYAGYGEKKIEEFKQAYKRYLDENGISKNTVSFIGIQVAGELNAIKKYKELLSLQLKEIENPENMSDSDKKMVLLYSNEENKEEYIQNFINNTMQKEMIKFDILNGHSKTEELRSVLIERLKLYGYSDEVCKEVENQMMKVKSNIAGSELINSMESIISPYISRNQRNIVLYTNAGANNFMESVSTQMGYHSKDDFIKKLLSCSAEELDQIYSKIDENILLPKDKSEEIKASYKSRIEYWQDIEQQQESIRAEKLKKIRENKDVYSDERSNDLEGFLDAYNKGEQARANVSYLENASISEQLNSKMNHMNASKFKDYLLFFDMLQSEGLISMDSLAKNSLQQKICESETNKFEEIVRAYSVAQKTKEETK